MGAGAEAGGRRPARGRQPGPSRRSLAARCGAETCPGDRTLARGSREGGGKRRVPAKKKRGREIDGTGRSRGRPRPLSPSGLSQSWPVREHHLTSYLPGLPRNTRDLPGYSSFPGSSLSKPRPSLARPRES